MNDHSLSALIAPARAFLFDDTTLLVPTKSTCNVASFLRGIYGRGYCLATKGWTMDWSGMSGACLRIMLANRAKGEKQTSSRIRGRRKRRRAVGTTKGQRRENYCMHMKR